MQFVFDIYVNKGKFMKNKMIEFLLYDIFCRGVVEISQGLNSFDYSRNFNLIGKKRKKGNLKEEYLFLNLATAGVNYQVSLWNPFVLSKPNGVIEQSF